MEYRPCIDIHNGKVKQIVGATLSDESGSADENFVSERGADFFAKFYKYEGLMGGHIILLNKADSPYYEATKAQAMAALKAYPGGMQVGGGINADNAGEVIYIDCDLMDAYSGANNRNNRITTSAFPVLEAGDNTITFTGLTNVEITPRWWDF